VLSVDHLRLTLEHPPVPLDGRRRAAVAIILDAGRVMLMVRAAREGDPWSGQISLPGGGYQASDGDLLTTAIRETREEIGVELNDARVIGSMPATHPMTSGPLGIEVTPYVFASPAGIAPALGPEAVGWFWLDLSRAAAGEFDGRYTYRTGMEFPCWNFDGHVIWGLTFRILQDLLARAASAP
jgi:8-oxo-dGTP pyrophosphatase MutT (NUDIX family)